MTLALRNILRNIRPIGVIKSKFKSEEVNIYGLILFIFNSTTRKMLRYAAVAGCNPAVYETDIGAQWFAFEKQLYSQRLKEGSLREITQKIEQLLLLKIQDHEIEDFYNSWNELEIEKISGVFKKQIQDVIKYDKGIEYDVNVEIRQQQLNLRQFKYLTDTEKIDEEFKLHIEHEKANSTLIALDMELMKAKKGNPGIRVEKIVPGDMVYTIIKDSRDIGVYLAHLLGARKEDSSVPFSASVENVRETEEGVELIVRYGPGIVGKAVENPKKKIRMIKKPITKDFKWWYIIIAFAAAIGYYMIFRK
ncbi:MAG: hypothetical protein ABIH89_03330 [Elusimicrobiota bacterium]